MLKALGIGLMVVGFTSTTAWAGHHEGSDKAHPECSAYKARHGGGQSKCPAMAQGHGHGMGHGHAMMAAHHGMMMQGGEEACAELGKNASYTLRITGGEPSTIAQFGHAKVMAKVTLLGTPDAPVQLLAGHGAKKTSVQLTGRGDAATLVFLGTLDAKGDAKLRVEPMRMCKQSMSYAHHQMMGPHGGMHPPVQGAMNGAPDSDGQAHAE